jgi:ribosomal protein L32
MTKREEKAGDNYFQKKQKKPLKWENLLEKCEKCGSMEIERMNMYQGMHRKGKGDNYQLQRCKSCGKEIWKKV